MKIYRGYREIAMVTLIHSSEIVYGDRDRNIDFNSERERVRKAKLE